MSPKVVDKPAKRIEILRSAMAVCARRGVHNFKMIDIANSAGVGKGTLYEYFTDKEDLVSGCFDLFLDDYDVFLRARLAGIVDPVTKLEVMVKASFEFFVKNRESLDILFDFWAASVRSHKGQPLMSGGSEGYSHVIDEVGGMIREGIKKGVFRPVDPKLAANMLLALLDGLWLQSVMGLIKINSRSLPQKISRMFLEGILK
ncbi:MAG: TetR/AcrR family transcriptional regulator [candidate division Zixibacteria bacterium]|nr:TetR/AcrR family transcriptional regulator [candidate division Zixibacteria bacterium]MDH3936845.1 TetR/AcrR family transcriptional regulator [candidate division Zixibacteria bacterium]MDH4033138.1 TetR/AcrR family transcriptional regulator [candidate division Zixibacteria bacterium]